MSGSLFLRYPVDYPHQPLILKIVDTKGLTASDSRALSKLLNSSSSEHAKQGVVAGFSLADACQEFLLGKNSPEAVKNDSTVSTTAACLIAQPVHDYYRRQVCRLVAPCGIACLSAPLRPRLKTDSPQCQQTSQIGAKEAICMVLISLVPMKCQKPILNT